MPVVTVACYTMWFVRNCPSRGQRSFFLQLHFFTVSAAGVYVRWKRTVLLCDAMMDFKLTLPLLNHCIPRSSKQASFLLCVLEHFLHSSIWMMERLHMSVVRFTFLAAMKLTAVKFEDCFCV